MVVDIVLLLLTVLLVALTAWLWCQSLYRVFMYDSTSGHVTGYRREDDCYLAEFQFVTASGETIEAVSDAGRGVKQWSPGQEIRVLYNRRDPRKATIRSVSSLGAAPIGLMLITAVFVFGAIKTWTPHLFG